MKKTIIQIIDKFYFLFKCIMPLKTYRYAACGGSNLVLDTILYFVLYNFLVAKKNINLHFVVLSPHIASLFFVFPITFLTGFALNKYITFQDSNISGRVQFFRYFVVGVGGIIISYASMKFFVDLLKVYPTPSRFITIIITISYSYLLQSKFSFRKD